MAREKKARDKREREREREGYKECVINYMHHWALMIQRHLGEEVKERERDREKERERKKGR